LSKTGLAYNFVLEMLSLIGVLYPVKLKGIVMGHMPHPFFFFLVHTPICTGNHGNSPEIAEELFKPDILPNKNSHHG
jgi:hypothetical protein